MFFIFFSPLRNGIGEQSDQGISMVVPLSLLQGLEHGIGERASAPSP